MLNLFVTDGKMSSIQVFGTVSLPLYLGHVYVAYRPNKAQKV